jgi:hypothetical protein
MNVMCRKTLPALLTGNTVVFKPASFTPWSAVFMARLFERAGLPAGVFNCVTGQGSSIGNVLVQDARVRAISFTGSTDVGKTIQTLAAPPSRAHNSSSAGRTRSSSWMTLTSVRPWARPSRPASRTPVSGVRPPAASCSIGRLRRPFSTPSLRAARP